MARRTRSTSISSSVPGIGLKSILPVSLATNGRPRAVPQIAKVVSGKVAPQAAVVRRRVGDESVESSSLPHAGDGAWHGCSRH